MPSRDYDPRRYGPTVSARVPPASRDVHSAPAATLNHARRERNDNLQFANSPRGTRPKRGSIRLWTDNQGAGDGVGVGVLQHELTSSSDDGAAPKDDRFRRPGEARAAPAPRSRAARTALSSKGHGSTKTKYERFHLHHAELFSPFDHTTYTTTAPASFDSSADTTAASASDTAGASPGARGRTRRRSLSWHLRQRITRLQLSPASAYNASSVFESPAALGSLTNSYYYGSSSGGGGGGGGGFEATAQKGRGRRRRGSSRKSGKARERSEQAGGESIDAEELFRRKNKMSAWNVTHGRWAESYDRSMARRASLERRERLELQREENKRRHRAEEEFQKWLRNHAPRSASSPSSGVAAAAANTSYASAATAALGPRSSYQERAASASPLRRQWLRRRQEAWTDGEGERGDTESEGLGGSGYRRRTDNDREEVEKERERERERGEREREQEEEKRRKVDRAFRAWLDRKKKQAQAEREAQRRRDEALTKLRKLEASRRWKKRPVVCAYTYGAKIGARNWKDEPNQEVDGGGQHDHGQAEEEEGEGGQKKQEQESNVSDREEGEDGDGAGGGLRQEGRATEERADEAGRLGGNGNSRAGEGSGAEKAEGHEDRVKDEDQRDGDTIQEGGETEGATENDEESAEERGCGAGCTLDEADTRGRWGWRWRGARRGGRKEHPQERGREEEDHEQGAVRKQAFVG